MQLRTQPHWHSDYRFPAPRTVRNKFLLFISYRQNIYGISLWRPELSETPLQANVWHRPRLLRDSSPLEISNPRPSLRNLDLSHPALRSPFTELHLPLKTAFIFASIFFHLCDNFFQSFILVYICLIATYFLMLSLLMTYCKRSLD